MPKSSIGRLYGWRPDTPDNRDRLYSSPVGALEALPPKVDLRPDAPPIYDQGSLGSCTAQAIGGCFQFMQRQQAVPDFVPSRNFIYYNERADEGTISSDAGAMLRTGIKSVAKQGVCPEPMWPYDVSRFKEKPTPDCYTVALEHQSLIYQRVPRDLGQMKSVLASKLPFVFGFTVYESFESKQVQQTGFVPMPSVRDRSLGGHAVGAFGFDDQMQCFIVRNSWGAAWGDAGYCYMPFLMLISPNISDDFWVIQKVEPGVAPPIPDPFVPPPSSYKVLDMGKFNAYAPARAGDMFSVNPK